MATGTKKVTPEGDRAEGSRTVHVQPTPHHHHPISLHGTTQLLSATDLSVTHRCTCHLFNVLFALLTSLPLPSPPPPSPSPSSPSPPPSLPSPSSPSSLLSPAVGLLSLSGGDAARPRRRPQHYLPHLSDEQRMKIAHLDINCGTTAKQIAHLFRGRGVTSLSPRCTPSSIDCGILVKSGSLTTILVRHRTPLRS